MPFQDYIKNCITELDKGGYSTIAKSMAIKALIILSQAKALAEYSTELHVYLSNSLSGKAVGIHVIFCPHYDVADRKISIIFYENRVEVSLYSRSNNASEPHWLPNCVTKIYNEARPFTNTALLHDVQGLFCE
jgi:hypothetical protein